MAESFGSSRASRRRALAVVLVAAAALVLSLIMLIGRRHAVTTRTTERTTTIGSPNRIPLTDCVDAARCTVGPATPGFVAHVRVWFPQAQILGTSSASASAPSAAPSSADPSIHRYRQSVDLRTAEGVDVTVSSRCVPGGVGVQDNRYPQGLLTVGPVQVVITAGPAQWDVDVGCSVTVVLDVPSGVNVPMSAGDGLAHDPALGSTP